MNDDVGRPREPETTDATPATRRSNTAPDVRPVTDSPTKAADAATAGSDAGVTGGLRRRATVDPGDSPPLPPRPPAPVIEQPSPDVELGQATVLPGVHRGGFQRLPTEPVGLTVESAPAEPGTEDRPVEWIMPEPRPTRGLAGWALAFAIAGLAVSLVVGWGFPLGLIGLIVGIVSLRRPGESRALAIWSLALAAVSLLYSAGWLLWASSTGTLFV
ncbi:hypothetical protein [Microbacterium sp. SLBN-146]|uniref:hypothetical protein n=1 Tax=Microbacterium sp. SLBN-146 TaxID=2768457 RepID=UPI00117331AF|nr:hypothetical protein [Microbacterium sp. SLBN-146]TQJ29678.1 putative membrane protein [Microbacterium sp. SLBN-146]